MSRKRKNEELEKIEQLERSNKSLRTLNKSLMRKIKTLDKKFVPEFTEEIKRELEDKMQPDLCQECFKGNLVEVNLGPRKFIKCDSCQYRTKTTKT